MAIRTGTGMLAVFCIRKPQTSKSDPTKINMGPNHTTDFAVRESSSSCDNSKRIGRTQVNPIEMHIAPQILAMRVILRFIPTKASDRRRQERWIARRPLELPPSVERKSGVAVLLHRLVRPRCVKHLR